VIIFGSELIGMVISTPYFVVTEALFGATITTFLLRLRVVKADGSPTGWGRVDCPQRAREARWFRLLSNGFIAVCASAKRQRVGDVAAGTFASAAVSRRPARAPAKLVLTEGA
jgi:uncharacterized RDD family membrane protein YckC